MEKILITGVAGFIGFNIAKSLSQNYEIIGLDNLNDYYDIKLKKDRLSNLIEFFKDQKNSKFSFVKLDLNNKRDLQELFKKNNFNYVLHFAAQAGVRYSLQNPQAYIDSNINGFLNLLESCKKFKPSLLLYASSSSVYGLNKKLPFSEKDKIDKPISLYASSKIANELMAYNYSHLFGIRTLGLRLFTVYGPWGRPDMALFKFCQSILNDQKIEIFNNGNMMRDFTYVDDVVSAIKKIILLNSREKFFKSNEIYEILNLGSNNPVRLLKFVNIIEEKLNKKAKIDFKPLQPGDVIDTYADISLLKKRIKYKPSTSLEEGITEFINWYKNYYGES